MAVNWGESIWTTFDEDHWFNPDEKYKTINVKEEKNIQEVNTEASKILERSIDNNLDLLFAKETSNNNNVRVENNNEKANEMFTQAAKYYEPLIYGTHSELELSAGAVYSQAIYHGELTPDATITQSPTDPQREESTNKVSADSLKAYEDAHRKILESMRKPAQKTFIKSKSRTVRTEDITEIPRSGFVTVTSLNPLGEQPKPKAGNYDKIEEISNQSKSNTKTPNFNYSSFIKLVADNYGVDRALRFSRYIEDLKNKPRLEINEGEETLVITEELALTLANTELTLKYGEKWKETENDYIEELAILITKYRDVIVRHKRKVYDE